MQGKVYETYVEQVMTPTNERQFAALSVVFKERHGDLTMTREAIMTSLFNIPEANMTPLWEMIQK